MSMTLYPPPYTNGDYGPDVLADPLRYASYLSLWARHNDLHAIILALYHSHSFTLILARDALPRQVLHMAYRDAAYGLYDPVLNTITPERVRFHGERVHQAHRRVLERLGIIQQQPDYAIFTLHALWPYCTPPYVQSLALTPYAITTGALYDPFYPYP